MLILLQLLGRTSRTPEAAVGVNNLGQFYYGYAGSDSLTGQGAGVIFGAGTGFSVLGKEPVTPGEGKAFLVVAGAAVPDGGAVVSGSVDESGATGLPAPAMVSLREDVATGLGFVAASGNVDTTTYATPPLIPLIPMSDCHL